MFWNQIDFQFYGKDNRGAKPRVEREALFQEIFRLEKKNEEREAQNAILRQRIENLRNRQPPYF